jgi:hypothetical protein
VANAKQKAGQQEAEARAVQGTPAAQDEAREGEAEKAEAQLAEQAKAEERRARDAQKASELKSAPADAEAPPTQKGSGEEAQYSVARLTADAYDFLGYPPHVVAGAFAGSDQEYYTRAEAKALVEKWLDSEVEYVHAEEA